MISVSSVELVKCSLKSLTVSAVEGKVYPVRGVELCRDGCDTSLPIYSDYSIPSNYFKKSHEISVSVFETQMVLLLCCECCLPNPVSLHDVISY